MFSHFVAHVNLHRQKISILAIFSRIFIEQKFVTFFVTFRTGAWPSAKQLSNKIGGLDPSAEAANRASDFAI